MPHLSDRYTRLSHLNLREVLADCYKTGGDPYKAAARILFELPDDASVTPEQRRLAKSAVFKYCYLNAVAEEIETAIGPGAMQWGSLVDERR